MHMPPAPQAPRPVPFEMAEILRQSLSAFLVGNPIAQYLDRLEDQR